MIDVNVSSILLKSARPSVNATKLTWFSFFYEI